MLAFSHAVSDYNRMHSAETLAVMHGLGFRFTEEIVEARARMEELKYAIIAHEEAHGCACTVLQSKGSYEQKRAYIQHTALSMGETKPSRLPPARQAKYRRPTRDGRRRVAADSAASNPPNVNRPASMEMKPHASPVNAVNPDQQKMAPVMMPRDPKPLPYFHRNIHSTGRCRQYTQPCR